jgi:hypothetical protein
MTAGRFAKPLYVENRTEWRLATVWESFLHTSFVMRTEEMVSRSFLADFWIDGDQQIR